MSNTNRDPSARYKPMREPERLIRQTPKTWRPDVLCCGRIDAQECRYSVLQVCAGCPLISGVRQPRAHVHVQTTVSRLERERENKGAAKGQTMAPSDPNRGDVIISTMSGHLLPTS